MVLIKADPLINVVELARSLRGIYQCISVLKDFLFITVTVIRDRMTGQCRGFAYVVFFNLRAASYAQKAMDGQVSKPKHDSVAIR